MKFVLNRNHVLQSTLGHSIGFEKGVAVHVPKEMWNAALSIGASPEDDLPESVLAPTKEPADPEERKAAIMAGFEQLVLSGKRENFTGTGVPHAKALVAQLGFAIDNKERDALWMEFKTAEKAE
jgi:hypothetical protein